MTRNRCLLNLRTRRDVQFYRIYTHDHGSCFSRFRLGQNLYKVDFLQTTWCFTASQRRCVDETTTIIGNRTEKWQNTKSTPRNFSRNLGQRDGVKWTEKIARACVFYACLSVCVSAWDFPSKRRGERPKYSSMSEPRRVMHRHCTRFQFRGDDIINAYYVPPHRYRLVISFCAYLLYVIVW